MKAITNKSNGVLKTYLLDQWKSQCDQWLKQVIIKLGHEPFKEVARRDHQMHHQPTYLRTGQIGVRNNLQCSQYMNTQEEVPWIPGWTLPEFSLALRELKVPEIWPLAKVNLAGQPILKSLEWIEIQTICLRVAKWNASLKLRKLKLLQIK